MSQPPRSNGIPILGQSVVTVAEQARLNATDSIGQAIAQAKQMGIRHVRIQIPCAFESTTIDYILHLDAIEAAGGRIVSINEHAIQGPGGRPMIACHVVFRAPDSLFSSVVG